MDRLLARAYGGKGQLLAELEAEFGENLTDIDPADIIVETSDDAIEEDDPDPVARDYGPIAAPYLENYLKEPEVFAWALEAAFKRFVDINNSDPHIEVVRREARASVATPDPIANFLSKANIWQNRSARNAVKYVADGQRPRLFEINVYLALANVLSDHLPVIVEIEMVAPTCNRPLVQPVPPSIPSFPGLRAFSPIVVCTSASGPDPCRNLANCCGACDERTSLPPADGCLTGYHLVRAAAHVCRQFIAQHQALGKRMLAGPALHIVGGQQWTAMAGHLLYVKARSDDFAVGQGTEYFWRNPSILIGRDGIEVERELVSVHKELAARKHPRILFARSTRRPGTIRAQVGADADADMGDEDLGDVQDDNDNGGDDKHDWSYPRIAKEFASHDPVWFAEGMLRFLRTGHCPADDPALRQAFAGLLVTMFGVEANKDNSTYLTGILMLEGIATQRYTVGEVFHQVDPGNVCNLAGSLGLFPLASSDRANFYGKRRCIAGRATDSEAPWSEPRIMTAMLNIQPRCRDDIILKKEMVLLVDDVRARCSTHRQYNAAQLLQAVMAEWWKLLHSYYGNPWQ
ncbi:hypothetical protein ACFFTM_03040 [Pseudoduganella plicata]|uniref:Uncharacterized protein n=1 Tax=Pseudoduganella plicata TaxID=321984 RepID=A0A4P7BBM5_9BURK|nr:hypothetical protein [Pseudoduganella plicata]QBQ35247.1 hypothetical protein E1742_02985 [Pseudoduganella plicata]GGZ04696.1 hypothetical protein GCM10007388_42840 [Pseudoduganella plicata]